MTALDRRVVVSNGWRSLLTSQEAFLGLLIVVIGGVTTVLNPNFLTFDNLRNVLNQNAVPAIVAAGAALVMISGNFDISVGSLIGLGTSAAALLYVQGVPIGLAIPAGFLVCVVAGLLNGLLVAKTRTPSFIMTLAMLSVYHGIALVITGGATQSLSGEFTGPGREETLGLPNAIWIMAVVYVALAAFLRWTRLGRHAYAVGGNEEAAYLAGVPTERVKILLYLLNGVLVGVASIVLLSRLGAALPSTGSGMELRAIAAVVIGGVPLTGGKGNAVGIFLGVVLMGLISNVLNLLSISAYYQDIAVGLIIAVAVTVSNLDRILRK